MRHGCEAACEAEGQELAELSGVAAKRHGGSYTHSPQRSLNGFAGKLCAETRSARFPLPPAARCLYSERLAFISGARTGPLA